MEYSQNHLHTAGKITIYTTIVGVFAFALIFLLNLGNTHENQAIAQENATTSVTVLNTPPAWTVDAEEEVGSSTTTPTNAGNEVAWVAVGTDANSEPYYLLVCSDSATPTANAAAAPECDPGAIQWAVSASTTSGTQARAATTTTASSSPFAGESFPWYAWVCDDNVGTPRCSTTFRQGSGTTSSPFEVNHRPSFTVYSDDSPTDPGSLVTFSSTSVDPDSSGAQDTVRLIVCSEQGFSTSTDTCSPGIVLASTTVPGVAANASASYTIAIPTQDQNYEAWGYVIDNHGFEASGGANDTDSTLTVNNVAPTTSPSTISINGGSDIILSVESGETTGFTLQFITADNNSCENASSGDEITDYSLSLYRSGVSSTTCTPGVGSYDANDCYPSELATTTWNLTCTASSTSCTGPTDLDQVWDCTFPLWYIADPTDGTATSTQYNTENWLAQVQAIDDDFATGSLSESSVGVEVTSFLAFALNTLTIPYGALEPGNQTDPLVATTTIAATGNVGLDKDVQGESMCTTYTGVTPCPNSASSTISASEQVFATSTVAYADATSLSSTTQQEIEVNVPKSTATSTQAEASAYWGIRVPISITFAGDYTGENTITALVGESLDW